MRLRSLIVLPFLLALHGCGASTGETAARASVPQLEVAGLERLEQAIAENRGHPLLLNFWATWCPPCVAELPALVATAKENESRGLRVLGVSFDLMMPDKKPDEMLAHVRSFLEQRGLALPTLIFDGADYDAINERFQLPGAIPVTLAIDRTGKVVDRLEGESNREEFGKLARKVLEL